MANGVAGKIEVAYVAGWMRSGTTLLTEMLGASSGAVALGEISGTWGAVRDNAACSCGEVIHECPVWAPALSRVYEDHGLSASEANELSDLAARVLRTRDIPKLRRAARHDTNRGSDILQLRDVMQSLLSGLHDAIEGRLIIDSSKLPPGYLLQNLMNNVQVRVLHIVRDPRGVAASEVRTLRPPRQDINSAPPGKTAWRSAAYWSLFNSSIALTSGDVSSYMRTGYETLVQDGVEELGRIHEFLGLETPTSHGLDAGHIVVGNPARLQGAHRAIRIDDRWRRELSRKDQLVVSGLAIPGRIALRVFKT